MPGWREQRQCVETLFGVRDVDQRDFERRIWIVSSEAVRDHCSHIVVGDAVSEIHREGAGWGWQGRFRPCLGFGVRTPKSWGGPWRCRPRKRGGKPPCGSEIRTQHV